MIGKFFVTIFINDRVFQLKIDELIQNSSNGYVCENFVFGCKKTYLPISIQGKEYYISNKLSLYEVKRRNQVITDSVLISHGDYFSFISEELSYSVLILDYNQLSLSQKAYELGTENVFIGRSEEMDVVLDINDNISRKCAAIRTSENGDCYVEDLSGKTGIYVNGHKETSKKLEVGDDIYIMGTTISYQKGMLIVPANISTKLKAVEEFEVITGTRVEDDEMYVRTPRIIKGEDSGKIVIDAPTAPQKSKEIPFLLSIGPSATMALAMVASVGVTIANMSNGGSYGSLITGIVMALCMLAGALLWPTLLRRYNRKQDKLNEEHRQKRYQEYLVEKEQEILQKYQRNMRVLNENLMPSPDSLSDIVAKKSRKLWERSYKDEDFLSLRLGIGERDFAVEIQSPPKGFTLEDDPMLDKAISLKQHYDKMKGVPISLSLLDKKVIGVVGSTIDVFKAMLSNIVCLHAPEEVKIVLVYNASDINNLQWANDLPHVWNNDKKIRFVATNKEEAKSLFSSIDEYVSERERVAGHDNVKVPIFVVFVLDDKLVEDLPFRRYLINPDNNAGVSTVFFGKKFSSIPKECVAIIQKEQDICGMYIKNENNNKFIEFVLDEFTQEHISQISIGLKQIKTKTEKGKDTIPDRVTFLDMFRVGNVGALEIMNHWQTNLSEKTLAAPIGIKAGGGTFDLDIHEKAHGCHGLVAGTTGSGKSEFLQAYILSMMINYSPNEVGFVLVDFKGGDMARPFLKSPHLAATISNLSGNTLRRALISLEAEVKSRQRTFNLAAEELGVDKIDINSYHKFFKDKKLRKPLPHLIIVIDEFAQLKSQHPEFMSKLVDVAQVGRSLGIHLILATQRPSGVVDPQIWSNSKFKVCLKVLDKQDSSDMINRPDAALIKLPGRAYVQVGYDEIFEQIQSGYSGADYFEQEEYIDEESISVNLVNWPAEKVRTVKKSIKERKSNKTQLEEVVSVIAELGEQNGNRVAQLWLPPLPLKLLLESCGVNTDFDEKRWEEEQLSGVVLGLADIPEKQRQIPYELDFLRDGHLAIYGSSGTGKSTLIQSILFSYALKMSPEMFNVIVLDFNGNSLSSIMQLPHCIGYATEGDENAVQNIFSQVGKIMVERQELFAKNNCANYQSYISTTNSKLPMMLFVLDNYAAFREKMYRMEDALVQIISAARACGIFLIVTGNSKGAIYYRVTEQISNKIILNMNDSGAYRDVLGVSIPIEPEQTKGRGLTLIDKKPVEVQFAVPFDVENEAIRIGRIQKSYASMTKHGKKHDLGKAKEAVININVSQNVSSPFYTDSSSVIKAVETVDAEKCLVAGFDIKTGQPKGFDLNVQSKVFVATRGDNDALKAILGRFVDKTDKNVYIFTETPVDVDEERAQKINNIDDFITEFAASSKENKNETVLVINGFCDFYDKISDKTLSILEGELSKENNLKIITFDDLTRINDYRDTGIYVNLIRTAYGVVVNGGIDDSLASLINTEIYKIPCKNREVVLKEGQAIIYSKDAISLVDIKGE